MSYEKVTHCIFDMDGLLINTETIYTKVTNAVLARFGTSYNMEIKSKLMGRKQPDASQILIDELGISDQVTSDELYKLMQSEWDNQVQNIELLPGAEKLVRHLKTHSVPISISTGSSEASFILKTKNFQEFFNLFDFVVKCGSDPQVKHGKPAPDAFEVARQRFLNSPMSRACLAFEDAPNGVESALAAGMQVVMVPDPAIAPYVDTSRATLLLNSLEEFKPELFGLPQYE